MSLEIKDYMDNFIMDMHIHPRPGCFEPENIDEYIKAALEKGIGLLGFLEHGPRISHKHKGKLVEFSDIERFCHAVSAAAQRSGCGIKVYAGIELDYSPPGSFREKNLSLAQGAGLDYVVGSVHGFSAEPYGKYLEAAEDLIECYPINILGHLEPPQSLSEWETQLRRILYKAQKKDIAIEINTSEKRAWPAEMLAILLKWIEEYGLKITVGSDAHKLCNMGMGIADAFNVIRESGSNWEEMLYGK